MEKEREKAIPFELGMQDSKRSHTQQATAVEGEEEKVRFSDSHSEKWAGLAKPQGGGSISDCTEGEGFSGKDKHYLMKGIIVTPISLARIQVNQPF